MFSTIAGRMAFRKTRSIASRQLMVMTYMAPGAMSAVKTRGKDAIVKALLDPMYPRTIRIVMNEHLSIDIYTAGIVMGLQPRMNGQDLEKLDEFKTLNPPLDLIKGAEIEMTIDGDVMLYSNSAGSVGQIVSRVLCEAMCDVYYGDDAVFPEMRDSTVEDIAKGLRDSVVQDIEKGNY